MSEAKLETTKRPKRSPSRGKARTPLQRLVGRAANGVIGTASSERSCAGCHAEKWPKKKFPCNVCEDFDYYARSASARSESASRVSASLQKGAELAIGRTSPGKGESERPNEDQLARLKDVVGEIVSVLCSMIDVRHEWKRELLDACVDAGIEMSE